MAVGINVDKCLVLRVTRRKQNPIIHDYDPAWQSTWDLGTSDLRPYRHVQNITHNLRQISHLAF